MGQKSQLAHMATQSTHRMIFLTPYLKAIRQKALKTSVFQIYQFQRMVTELLHVPFFTYIYLWMAERRGFPKILVETFTTQ
jgi:hypothetical protein